MHATANHEDSRYASPKTTTKRHPFSEDVDVPEINSWNDPIRLLPILVVSGPWCLLLAMPPTY